MIGKIDNANRFRELTISGSPRQRGLAHGEALRPQIRSAIEFYIQAFHKTENEILQRARHFRQVIAGFNQDYATEIEAIALGANVDPLWVYALNSRSEIMSRMRPINSNECTALCFGRSAILGQNWDWAQHLETLCVLLRIESDAHTVYTFTEPGVLAKIGMNSAGIGVGLNFLSVDKPLDGVPIHVLLRAILDSGSWDQAMGEVHRAGLGRAGNIMIAAASGQCGCFEFAGDQVSRIEAAEDVLIHTNHFLALPVMRDEDELQSSLARLRAARERAAGLGSYSFADMSAILSDRSDPALPIYRDYRADPDLEMMGTVCTIIMDLANQDFFIRKGNTGEGGFIQAFAA